jgi:hypothetical protein
MRFAKSLGIALSFVVISLFVLTVSAQDAAETEATAILYIGTVTGIEDEFVGLALDGENATIYICDGQADKGTVSIAQWFVGTVADNAIDITADNGNRVEAVVDAESETASGKFTFADGSTKDFVLSLAEGEASLYRSDFTLNDSEFVGGWLILADGTVRGAVFEKETQELAPATFFGSALPKKKEEA